MSPVLPRPASLIPARAHVPAAARPCGLRTAAPALTAAVALTASLGAAGPAQAATVNELPTTTISTTLAPQGSAVQVVFDNRDLGEGNPLFPAGTYWVSHTTYTEAWASLRGDAGHPAAHYGQSWTRVDQQADGPLSVDLTDVGTAGTTHTLAVYPMPAEAGDPAEMTPAALDDAFDAHYPTQRFGDPVDQATVVAATVEQQAELTPLRGVRPSASDAELGLCGDFLGLGIETTGYRSGNVFRFAGTDGRTVTMSFGRPSDEVYVGDFDGDGRDSIALRRGNTFYIDDDFSGGAPDQVLELGRATDEVYVGDFDGDGRDTLALRRGSQFFISTATNGVVDARFSFGRATDLVEIEDWDGSGRERVGLMRQVGDGPLTLLVRHSLSAGPADAVYAVRS